MKPLHFSQLKHIASSPAHYLDRLNRPWQPTAAMRKGTCVDLSLFRSMALGARPWVIYDGTRDKRHRAYQEFLAGHPEDVIVLSEKEAQDVLGCLESLDKCPDAHNLLQGTKQQTVTWEINGRACEGTPDVFSDDYVTDLKTTRCSSPEKFRWDARRLGYHAQLAWYRHGLLQSGLASPQTAYIVAVETAPPYPVTCFELSEQALDQGERTWRLWFERLRACEESNEWPAYAQSIVALDFETDDSFDLVIDGETVSV